MSDSRLKPFDIGELLDGDDEANLEQASLQRADEALGTAVALWHPDVRRRALDPEQAAFPLESVTMDCDP